MVKKLAKSVKPSSSPKPKVEALKPTPSKSTLPPPDAAKETPKLGFVDKARIRREAQEEMKQAASRPGPKKGSKAKKVEAQGGPVTKEEAELRKIAIDELADNDLSKHRKK